MATKTNRILIAVRKAFKDTGQSMKWLSDETKLSYSQVHGCLTGTRDIETRTLSRICDVLKLELRPKLKRK